MGCGGQEEHKVSTISQEKAGSNGHEELTEEQKAIQYIQEMFSGNINPNDVPSIQKSNGYNSNQYIEVLNGKLITGSVPRHI